MLFTNCRVVLPDRGTMRGAVAVEGDRVTSVIPAAWTPPPADRVIDLRDAYLSPGFVDLHIHGSAGVDVGDAEDPELDPCPDGSHRRASRVSCRRSFRRRSATSPRSRGDSRNGSLRARRAARRRHAGWHPLRRSLRQSGAVWRARSRDVHVGRVSRRLLRRRRRRTAGGPSSPNDHARARDRRGPRSRARLRGTRVRREHWPHRSGAGRAGRGRSRGCSSHDAS